MFDFHKLYVYQKSKLVNKKIVLLTEDTRINKNVKDQLIRSSSSVLLNIAEGSGRSTSKDKSNFYVIARGSAYECVALLDILHDMEYIDKKIYEDIYGDFEEVVKMLFGLIKSLK